MNIKVDRDLFLSELYYLQGVAGAKQMNISSQSIDCGEAGETIPISY